MVRSRLSVFFFICILIFTGTGITAWAGQSAHRVAMAVPRDWNTFLGGSQYDRSICVITDSAGNIYVGGNSASTWGNPLRPFTTGSSDGFIAKFGSRGNLIWNTFIGENSQNNVSGLFMDSSGTLYVVGSSSGTWGTPVTPYTGQADGFIARFDSNGTLLWNTFIGGAAGNDGAISIITDSSGAMYVTGQANCTWGAPIRAWNPGGTTPLDAFVTKLSANGTVQWHTYLGGNHMDWGEGITVDSSGNVFLGGRSVDTWGTPLNPHAGYGTWDAFAARLDPNGNLVWNTFIGVPHYMYGCIGDRSGNIYQTGQCYSSFGNPIRPYQSGDMSVVKINPSGGIAWNTFLGSADPSDQGYGLALDRSGNVYVSGRVDTSWGTPRQPYTGGRDCMVAKLSFYGHLLWHTFMGSATDDEYPVVAVNSNGAVYVAGQSDATWGNPVRPYSGQDDGFLIRFDQYPEVSGYVLDPDGQPVSGVEVFFSGDPNPEITNPSGRFSNTVDFGWSGTITPHKEGTTFEPEMRQLSNVSIDRGGQDFTARKLALYHITGTITLPDGSPLAGVTLTVSGLDQVITTGADGRFDVELPDGWSGTVTPSCPMYDFIPAGLEYDSLAESKNGQNFQANPILNLSGERLTEKAWIVTKSYCRLKLTMARPEPSAGECVLQKKTGGSEFQTVQTFSATDFMNGEWTFVDMDVEENQPATYRVTVKDAAGNVIYRCPEISL